MQYPTNICEWKIARLRESKAESYCAKCLRLESIAVYVGDPELCQPCQERYSQFLEGQKNS
jgi:hypothetical protein